MKPMLTRAYALTKASSGLPTGGAAAAAAITPGVTTCPSTRRPFSVLDRPPPNYPGHVPLTYVERAGLAIGSGIMSFMNPYRGDLIAAFAEATSTPYFIPRLRDAMLRSPTGRRILRDRPRLTSTSLNLPYLRTLPPTSVGGTYVAWLDREHVTPDTRAPVRYIDDEECAYVMQRYRECHDFSHALTGLPVVREGEVALKAFEWANTGLPMTGLSMFSALTMKKGERKRFREVYLPWALRNGWRAQDTINVYWEEELESDVEELRSRLGIERPPDMREIRRREREDRKRQKAHAEE
ncbi:Ubiquinone biosynthesis protein [Gnomoniopsis sp. IMI 355080]|nr:Ubiquinone biosynthesis protein [Gnomoniopsis sp. IMI 355080]